MNKRNYIISLSVACLSMGACKKSSFVDANINPNTLYSVDPADQFLEGALGLRCRLPVGEKPDEREVGVGTPVKT